MKCDDCGNDVIQRLALTVEVEGQEEDGSNWVETRERMLCTRCYRKRMDSIPRPGIFTQKFMDKYGIDEKLFVNEGNVIWDRQELKKMVDYDENDPNDKPKLKPEFKHLAKNNTS